MALRNFVLGGIGLAQPEQRVEQAQTAEWTSLLAGHDDAQTRRLGVLYRRAGVRTRSIAILERIDVTNLQARPDWVGPSTAERMEHYEASVGPLAFRASSRALDASGCDPASITHLITVSCTGFAAPGFDLALIRGLGLNPEVTRTHVGFMGCHAALNALRVARAFAADEPAGRVLVCAAELCSLHFRYGPEAERSVSNAIFADGAAAVVGGLSSATPDRTEAGAAPWELASSGSTVLADSSASMSWRIGDHGFAMTLGPEVPDLIGAHLRPWLERWLGRLGLTLDQVGSWAVHPGGPRILSAVQETLGLDGEALAESRAVLAECGNMSSPTILFILDRLRRRNAPRPCVALGFGPGLAIEAALFR